MSKYYQKNCTGYYIQLDDNNSFQLLYSFSDYEKDTDLIYGYGTYNLERNELKLSFEGAPKEKVELTKVRHSDSLIIHFNIIDEIDQESTPGTEVIFQRNKRKSFFYSNLTREIRLPFAKDETIKFRYLGYNTLRYKVDSPGVYKMDVTLIFYMGMNFAKGEVKRFKIINRRGFKELRDIQSKKILFTTKKCDPIIL